MCGLKLVALIISFYIIVPNEGCNLNIDEDENEIY